MDWDWEMIKAYLRVAYARGAQFFVFLVLWFYTLGCVVAGQPLGPKSAVEFVNYCFHWKPGILIASPVVHQWDSGERVIPAR